MNRYFAFLRGINVGGHRVTGAQLEQIFSQLGLESCTSFLASGNVVFDAKSDRGLVGRIEESLRSSLGYDVPTILRDAKATQAIAGHTPFLPAHLAGAKGKPQVTLLKAAPTPAVRKRVLALASADDRLVLDGKELYWLPRFGISQSELDMRALERELGHHTTRTMNTLQRLAKKFLPSDFPA